MSLYKCPICEHIMQNSEGSYTQCSECSHGWIADEKTEVGWNE